MAADWEPRVVAGRYDPASRTIEIAYWADPMVAVRQAAHGWFNGGLLADRWASEGFATLYANRVAATIGIDGADAPSTSGGGASTTADTSGSQPAQVTSPSKLADSLKKWHRLNISNSTTYLDK